MSIISSTANVPLDVTFQRVNDIRNNLEKGLKEEAKFEAKLFYKEVAQLIQTEIKANFSIELPTSAIVIDLSQILQTSLEEMDKSFYRSLSKSYRFFVGFAWFQSSKNNDLLTLENLKNSVDQTSQILLSHLSDKRGKQVTKEKLNYRYAQQAFLMEKKPIDHSDEKNETKKEPHLNHFITDFSKWAMQFKEIGNSHEFLKIHYLYWASHCITQLKDFIEIDKAYPATEYVKNKSSNYTAWLTITLMKFIRQPQVDQELKDYAFKYLQYLAELRIENAFSKILMQSKDGSSSKEKDCFLETRFLAKSYLHTLSKGDKDSYKPYQTESEKTLQILAQPTKEWLIEKRMQQLKILKVEFATDIKMLEEQKKAANRGESTNYDEKIMNVKKILIECIKEEKTIQANPLIPSLVSAEMQQEAEEFAMWES